MTSQHTGDMHGISGQSITTLVLGGLVIGSLYALLLILAFRLFGRAGAGVLTVIALAAWGMTLVTATRFREAPSSLLLAMWLLVVTLSVVPALTVDRVRLRPGATYLRQAVYGIVAFYLAILGSLAIGLIARVAGMRGGW
jgi:hypothetical protein